MKLEITDEQKDYQISPTKIKVIGLGGGGSNAVYRMIEKKMEAVDFIAINTDVQALYQGGQKVDRTRLTLYGIGSKLTGGLGAGGNPEIGKKAAEEDAKNLEELLKGTDMVFLTAGMGGGTGTGAISTLGSIARKVGALTVAVVTKPFNVEGKRKMRLAEEGIRDLYENVDTVITIPNELLLKIVEKNAPIQECFMVVNDVLYQAVKGISELITKTGVINIDFNDLKSIMNGKGDALMGIGRGVGDNAALDAAQHAINNPLLEDAQIEGAKGILVNITGNSRLSLDKYNEVVDYITKNADENANIKSGLVIDETFKDDEIQVSVVATGFPPTKIDVQPIEEESSLVSSESQTVELKEWENFGNSSFHFGNDFSNSYDLSKDETVPAFVRRYGRMESHTGKKSEKQKK